MDLMDIECDVFDDDDVDENCCSSDEKSYTSVQTDVIMDSDCESVDENAGSSSSKNSCNTNSKNEQILSDADLCQLCQNVIFVDMRGFRSNFGRFICKEFCLIESDGKIYHKFVKSPFLVKKMKHIYQVKMDYEQNYGHRIPYDYGNIDIRELITDTYDKLIDPTKKILVRDIYDRRNLKYIFRNYHKFDSNDRFLTLNDLSFDREMLKEHLDVLPFCDFHNATFGWGSGPCAKNITLKLRYIFTESEKAKKSE